MPDALPETDLDAPQRVQARIRAHLASLQSAELRVAKFILENPNVVIYKSTSELGHLADTSGATVVRCVQKMGFKGFHDLKLGLANDLAVFEQQREAQQASVTGDPRVAVLAQITRAGAESVRDAGALVDPAAFDASVSAIAGARRVLFLGVGTSAPLCQDAAYRFAAIGALAEAPADTHVQHVTARLLLPEDVCVLVSHSGATRETLAGAELARAGGATTVAITSFASSPLTEIVDHTIVAGTRELALRLEAMASRLAHLALLDALLVAVAGRDERRSQAALGLYASVLGEHRL